MLAQMFEKIGHIALGRAHQDTISALNELRKNPQIAQVCLAGQRPKAFLHA